MISRFRTREDALEESNRHIANPQAVWVDGWLAKGERTIDSAGVQTEWYYGPDLRVAWLDLPEVAP
jgi:hypothetical protein